MGKGVEKGKKKKGRPSLLDLQKRSIKEQQQQNQQQKPSSNPYSKPKFRNPIVPNPNPNPNRRFTRRNPVPDGNSAAAETIYGDDDDDEDDSNGKRKEKKLKLVLRLPSHRQHRSSLNSTSLNSGSYGSDSNAEDENEETPIKKRKINAVGDGSDHGDAGKGENPNSASKATDKLSGILLESGPTTPLPDIKLLVFILDRIQKKDTYSVFSEPVDPKELPDYHEIITHPMDFGTVRMKLAAGAYASLEQFEKDVFLICSNAMQYNAPDTIYFRQARSIQELAKKNFENLRQDSDDNEPEPKVVRRGRPPTKNLKKPLGRPPFERAGSEFSDATLATGADKSIWSNSYDLRKGPLSDKTGTTDASAKAHSGDGYASRFAEHKSGRNDEYPGSMLKGMSMKYGKKNFVLDENKRNTYQQSYTLVNGREPSVLTTFDGERQQLMAVGLHSEYGYSRSLARFAANLGPVAWKVASEKIKRALPAGLKFGPGWVGENEVLPPPQPPLSSPPPPARHLPPQQPHSLHKIPSITTAAPIIESREIPLEKQEPSNNPASDCLPSRPLPPSSSPSAITNRTSDPTTTGGLESVRGLNYESGFSSLNSAVGAVRPRPPFQIHQSPVIHSTLNGFSGGFGFNLASQMGKLVRPARPPSSFGLEASMTSQMHDMVSKSNRNFVNQMPANRLESEDPKLLGISSTINAHNSLPDSSYEAQATPGAGVHTRPSWRGPSLHQKPDSVPPDLNVRFQSPGSPSSNLRVDSPQPDLALQL